MRKFACLCALATAACAAASPVPSAAVAATPPLARGDGLLVTEADLDRYVAAHPKVARQLYDVRHAALEEITVDALVEAAAQRAGQSPEDWVRAQVDRRVPVPSDAEVRAYFESRLVGENRNYRFEEIGPQIREHLLAQRRQEALGALLAGLKTDAHLVVFLPPPRVEVPVTGPAKGPASAPVTIVEFSDYECPFCQRQEAALQQLLAAYPDQVRLVVKDFPLPMHPDARRAAHAAVCAHRQGHFWELHDAMFGTRGAAAHQGLDSAVEAAAEPGAVDLSEAGLRRSAKALGLDGPRFDACLASGEAERVVAESQKAGEAAGVDGTPALFIDGRPFSGAVSFAELKATVDEELQLQASAPGAHRTSPGSSARSSSGTSSGAASGAVSGTSSSTFAGSKGKTP